MKFFEDFAPLLVFFILNARGADWFGVPPTQSLFIATGGFMLALGGVIILALMRRRRPNNMLLVSAGFVFFFGALTLLLRDETFIKIKPTITHLLFAAILAGGLKRGRVFLHELVGNALPLTQEGWVILTRRWIGLFLALAALNEAIWRLFSTDQWVAFKTFGVLPITIGFMLLQAPLLRRYKRED